MMSSLRLDHTTRRGVTLVEILVVTALIGILAALLTPALGRARERGRITTCTNNEYQIAFALMRYDEQHGSVPGWLNASPNGIVAPPVCSWPVPLLSYLGRSDVADMWGSLPALPPSIEQFVCPSTRIAADLLKAYPPLTYAGNVGVNGMVPGDGVFLRLYGSGSVPAISLDDISDADGTSTTLAFAEQAARGFAPRRWDYSLATLTFAFGEGKDFPAAFGAAGAPVSPVINQSSTRLFAPSSEHSDGVVVAFCDGHTGFLSNQLDPWVYGQLLTPKTRWIGGVNKTNSVAMQPWVVRGGDPYLLDERDLKAR